MTARHVAMLAVLVLVAACSSTPPPAPPLSSSSFIGLKGPKPRPSPLMTSITGRVMRNGQPVREFGLLVHKHELDTNSVLREIHAPDGRFTSAASPGNQELIIVGHTFARHLSERYVGEANTVLDVGDIEVTRGFTLEGTVTDPLGRRGSDAEVTIIQNLDRAPTKNVLAERARANFMTTTDRTGHFRIEGVTVPSESQRTFNLVVSKPGTGFAALPQHLSVMDHTLNILLVRAGQIRGTTSNNIDPILIATRNSGRGRSSFFVWPAPDGTFAVDVPGGNYLLRTVTPNRVRVTVVAGQVTRVALP